MEIGELVSVVVPAFNAGRTLGDTLASVRRQTHHNLEIVVVDDGSTDRTGEVARAHAAEDSRLRVVTTPNGGVAAARNAGVAVTSGAFVAPVDADDLWHPQKIERQLAAMRASSDIGFVYTLYRRIDGAGRVIDSCGHVVEGAAFLRALLLNFVGNGSALLLRRAAFDAVGGYDPALRADGVQGCEDYLLQLLVARHWRVACVPQYLTGYRLGDGAMSSDRVRMTHSHCRMLDVVARRFPEAEGRFLAASQAAARAGLGVRLLLRGRAAGGLDELGRALRRDAATTLRIAGGMAWRDARGIVARRFTRIAPRPAMRRPAFESLAPDARPHTPDPPPLAHLFAAAEAQEAAFFAPHPATPRGPDRTGAAIGPAPSRPSA